MGSHDRESDGSPLFFERVRGGCQSMFGIIYLAFESAVFVCFPTACFPAGFMKSIRFVLLLGVGIMFAAVVLDFLDSRRTQAKVGVRELPAIPSEFSSQSSRWSWSQTSGDSRKIEIFADSVRQTKETLLLELEGVELKIFGEDGKSYDQVLSGRAEFDSQSETLYSEGEVILALGLSLDDLASGAKPLTRIHSSGVTFESKTGICRTERYTEYEFEGGSGHSVGAFYDSIHHFLRMESEAYMERDPSSPGSPPLTVSAGELFYDENAHRIDLKGGVILRQGGREVQSAEAVIYLENGAIRRIEAVRARGSDQQQDRDIRFGAQSLTLFYDEQRFLERMLANGAAELRSASASSRIDTRGERIELSYVTLPEAAESVLREADVRGRARIEVTPSTRETKPSADIRRVAAEWIHLTMRQGGQEIERLETLTPGTLEIIPGAPNRWKRSLAARRITARYGAGNRMESLLAMGDVAATNTPPSAATNSARKPKAPLLTWSSNFAAEFDPEGEVTRLKQWEHFRFRQGSRKGSAGEAEFDLAANRVKLRGGAHVSEPAATVRGWTILLDDASGRLEASGNVTSTHSGSDPEAGAKTGTNSRGDGQKENEEARGGLFSSEQPVFASADHMVSDQETGVIDYRGGARLWQGPNRIEAEHIVIERQAKKLSAERGVRSLFQTQARPLPREASSAPEPLNRSAAKPEPLEQGPPKRPVIALSADSMHYDEETQTALYSGSATLVRGELTVHADEIEALIGPGGGEESSAGTLKTALARGRVGIFEELGSTAEQRRGFGEEAQYDPRLERLVLTGTPARLRSGNGSETRGTRLTYHVADDRLLVLGGDGERAYSYKPERRPGSP